VSSGGSPPYEERFSSSLGKQYAKYIQLLLAKGCSMTAEKHDISKLRVLVHFYPVADTQNVDFE
jgi:hypothetical protein